MPDSASPSPTPSSPTDAVLKHKYTQRGDQQQEKSPKRSLRRLRKQSTSALRESRVERDQPSESEEDEVSNWSSDEIEGDRDEANEADEGICSHGRFDSWSGTCSMGINSNVAAGSPQTRNRDRDARMSAMDQLDFHELNSTAVQDGSGERVSWSSPGSFPGAWIDDEDLMF